MSREDDETRFKCLPFVSQNLDENFSNTNTEVWWVGVDVDEDAYKQ